MLLEESGQPSYRNRKQKILERTGLVVGWKSIKNYSFYILNPNTAKQNPSVATLDTLVRYVRNAPKTDEAARKKNEGHFSYWYSYRDTYTKTGKPKRKTQKRVFVPKFRHWLILIPLLTTLGFYFFSSKPEPTDFSDSFNDTSADSLSQKGWILKGPDSLYWNKRDEKEGHLSLFTLDGDNYTDTSGQIGIKNLLLKEIKSDCFSTEIHLSNFIPEGNWQQVGLLLMEDTTYAARSVRLSLSFNDFFGGYTRPGDILLQAMSSPEGTQSKPEEIAHTVIFSADSAHSAFTGKNLQKSALKIEKINNTYRFLYATGQANLFAFKEITTRALQIRPRYVGIFALKGFRPDTRVIPAHIDFFSLKPHNCAD